MYICLNCIYLYLNVYCQCLMLTVCTKGLRVTQFQFSVCMCCTCGKLTIKQTWLDLTYLSVCSPLSTPAICSWFSSAPPILSSGLASWKPGKDSLPHQVKLPIHFTYPSTCLNVDVLSTPASVYNKPAVILTYPCVQSCLLTEDQTVDLQHSRMSSILFDPAEVLYSSTQDGCPIEEYVEEFIGLSHLVPWSDDVLKTLFWLGLDDSLVGQVPAPAIACSLTQYIDYVMLLYGSSLTVGEVDETPITSLSIATPFMSVLESVPESTTVHKFAPAFCPEYAAETMLPRTSAKRRKQRRSKQSVSAPACLPESVSERAPTPVPIVSNQFVPESSNETTPASEFHPDSLAKMAVTPEALTKMAAPLEARSATATMPEPLRRMKPRLRQTRLMFRVADPLLRSVRAAGIPATPILKYSPSKFPALNLGPGRMPASDSSLRPASASESARFIQFNPESTTTVQTNSESVPTPEFSKKPVRELHPDHTPISEHSYRLAPAPDQSPVSASALEYVPVPAPRKRFAAPAPRERLPVPTPREHNPISESSPRRGPVPQFSPKEIPVLKFTPERAADPSPSWSSSLVTARSAVPSPRQSSSLVTARSAVPSPRESSSLVTARGAIASPRESSSLVTARGAVPSPRESSSLVQESSPERPTVLAPAPEPAPLVSAPAPEPAPPVSAPAPEPAPPECSPMFPSPRPECSLDLGFVTELYQERFRVPISGTVPAPVQESVPRNSVPKSVPKSVRCDSDPEKEGPKFSPGSQRLTLAPDLSREFVLTLDQCREVAPHPEVYPENVPGPESSTERASIPEHHPGPDVLSEHSSVPSASEHRTVFTLIPELSQDPALSIEFSQSPDQALKLSQEFAQVHKFPLELAPNLESAPEPVPVRKLVQMITSVLKDEVAMREPLEYPALAKEAVCDPAAYPVVVAVGNLSVPYVPVTPAPLWRATALSAPPWWASASSASPWWVSIPPWWASASSAPPWLDSCSAGSAFLPWISLAWTWSSILPQFRPCTASLLDYVVIGASGSRSFEGGTVTCTNWASSALHFPASLLPLTCTPLSITHTWNLSVAPPHLSRPIKLPIRTCSLHTLIVWSHSCFAWLTWLTSLFTHL